MYLGARQRFFSSISGALVFLLSLVHLSVSEGREPAAPAIRIRRYEVLTGKAYAERASRLQTSRVYVVYSARYRKWIFTMTTKNGDIPVPLEAMAEGTVVPGSALGGDSDKRYRLGRKAKWSPSKEPLQRRVWTVTDDPTFNVFRPLDKTPRKPASNKRK